MQEEKLSWEDGMRIWAVEKHEQGTSIAEIAQFFNKNRSTIHAWIANANKSGKDSLKRTYTKRDTKLPQDLWERVDDMLAQSALEFGFETDYWSLPRLALLIEQTFGVVYSESHLSRIMRQRGYSWQVPHKVHRKACEADKKHWVKSTLPELEKKSG